MASLLYEEGGFFFVYKRFRPAGALALDSHEIVLLKKDDFSSSIQSNDHRNLIFAHFFKITPGERSRFDYARHHRFDW